MAGIILTVITLLLTPTAAFKFIVNTYYATANCDATSATQSVIFLMGNCITTSSTTSFLYTCQALPGSQTLQQTHTFANNDCIGVAIKVTNATGSSTCSSSGSTYECLSNPPQMSWPAVGFWEQETVPGLGFDTCIPTEGPDLIFAYPPTCQSNGASQSFKGVCFDDVVSSYTYHGTTCDSTSSVESYPANSCYRYDNGTNAYAACSMSSLPGIASNSNTKSPVLSTGGIIGIAIGGFAFLVIVFAACWYRRSAASKAATTNEAAPAAENPMGRGPSQDDEGPKEIVEFNERDYSSDYGSDSSTGGKGTAYLEKTEDRDRKRRGRHEQIALFAFTKEVKERTVELFGLPNPTTPLLWEQLRAAAAGPGSPPVDGIFRVSSKRKDASEESTIRMVFSSVEDAEDAMFRLQNEMVAERLDCKCSEVQVRIMRPTVQPAFEEV